MAMSIGWIEILVLLLTGGSGNEILDFIETQSFWRAKNVEVTARAMLEELKAGPAVDVAPLIKALGNEDFNVREEAARKLLAAGPAALPQLKEAAAAQDPEVASQANRLIQQLNGSGMARSVRRLMAIRTLGELKDVAALNTLKSLLDSKELFEADYAQQAIAAIEGRPFARKRTDAKLFLQDLRCLPTGCGVLARFEIPPGAPVDIAKILAEAKGLPPGADKDQALAQMQQMLIAFVERVGNIRLDGITLGVSEDVGARVGHVALIARGLFNRDAVCQALKEMELPTEMVGGMEVFSLKQEAHLLVTSNQVALMAGAREQQHPVEAFAKALQEPPLQSNFSKEMAALLETVEKDAHLWAVARMSESYRKAPLFAPFDAITLQGKEVDGSVALEFKAIGQDAEKVAGAVKMFEEGLKQALAELENNQQGQMFEPMTALLRSIQASQDGKEMRVAGKMSGSGVVAAMPFFLLMGRVQQRVERPPQAVPAPAAR